MLLRERLRHLNEHEYAPTYDFRPIMEYFRPVTMLRRKMAFGRHDTTDATIFRQPDVIERFGPSDSGLASEAGYSALIGVLEIAS